MHPNAVILFAAVALGLADAQLIRRPIPLQRIKPEPVPEKEDAAPIELIHRPVLVRTTPKPNPEDLQLQFEQNANARYEFESYVEDNIHDLQNSRHEIRDGLKVVGQYSYSDGYFKRTVHYEADEGGYRVTKQEEEPLAEQGPNVDPHGVASISTNAHGASINYKVKSVPKDDDYVFEEVL